MDKKKLFNWGFLIASILILIILLSAPKATTPPLPKTDNHKKFFNMSKKEAEKFCEDCHKNLPKNHPPKYRCLFCHKVIK